MMFRVREYKESNNAIYIYLYLGITQGKENVLKFPSPANAK